MRLLLAFVLNLLAIPALAGAAGSTSDWTGTWDTRWRDGGARLELHQNGDRVEGRYASLNGIVEGTIDGRVFKGQWHQGPRSGGFDFVLARDGRPFVERYETGWWWTGARVIVDTNAGDVIDLSTPRAAMRTFLNGGNAARYDAPDEMVKAAATVDFGNATLLPEERLARTKTLFNLVDATTFRLFTLPGVAAGDQITVTLQQAGTGVELPVHLGKTGGRWAIVMPDAAGLAASAKALYARSGGHPPGLTTASCAVRPATPSGCSPAPSPSGTTAVGRRRSRRSTCRPFRRPSATTRASSPYSTSTAC